MKGGGPARGMRLRPVSLATCRACSWSAAGPGASADAGRHRKRTGHQVDVSERDAR